MSELLNRSMEYILDRLIELDHPISVVNDGLVVPGNSHSRQIHIRCVGCGKRGAIGKAEYSEIHAQIWGSLVFPGGQCPSSQWSMFP